MEGEETGTASHSLRSWGKRSTSLAWGGPRTGMCRARVGYLVPRGLPPCGIWEVKGGHFTSQRETQCPCPQLRNRQFKDHRHMEGEGHWRGRPGCSIKYVSVNSSICLSSQGEQHGRLSRTPLHALDFCFWLFPFVVGGNLSSWRRWV